MSYNEAKFQTAYNTWKRYNMKITCAEELKIVKEDKFYLSDIEDHQILHLTNAHTGFFQFKIPDLGNQNPFDSFSLYKVPAYIVILWYRPRKIKNVYVIPITEIQGLIDSSIKSLTEQKASEIALYTFNLK